MGASPPPPPCLAPPFLEPRALTPAKLSSLYLPPFSPNFFPTPSSRIKNPPYQDFDSNEKEEEYKNAIRFF